MPPAPPLGASPRFRRFSAPVGRRAAPPSCLGLSATPQRCRPPCKTAAVQGRTATPIRPKPRPPLSLARILAWADDHHERTDRWPTSLDGTASADPNEKWHNLDLALREGYRALPGGGGEVFVYYVGGATSDIFFRGQQGFLDGMVTR